MAVTAAVSPAAADLEVAASVIAKQSRFPAFVVLTVLVPVSLSWGAGLFLFIVIHAKLTYMSIQFSHQLTDTNIYAHLLYLIRSDEAKVLDEASVLEVVTESVQQQNKHLQHKECNILIFAGTFGVIPEQGIGGRCGDSDLINVFIDPNHKAGVKHNIKKWLPSTLAHELCHARRYVAHPFGSTLADNLIEEGLACMFEEFMESDLQVPYAHSLTNDQLKQVWEKAKPVLKSKNYNHDDWFYGGSGIKKWTGYSLGYDIVRKYRVARNEKNPAKFIDVSADDFIQEYHSTN